MNKVLRYLALPLCAFVVALGCVAVSAQSDVSDTQSHTDCIWIDNSRDVISRMITNKSLQEYHDEYSDTEDSLDDTFDYILIHVDLYYHPVRYSYAVRIPQAGSTVNLTSGGADWLYTYRKEYGLRDYTHIDRVDCFHIRSEPGDYLPITHTPTPTVTVTNTPTATVEITNPDPEDAPEDEPIVGGYSDGD